MSAVTAGGRAVHDVGHLRPLSTWPESHGAARTQPTSDGPDILLRRAGNGTRPTSLANVFLTFALSGPMRPKQMGIILGFAVLRDALLVRLMLVTIPLRLAGRAAGGFRGGSTSSSH